MSIRWGPEFTVRADFSGRGREKSKKKTSQNEEKKKHQRKLKVFLMKGTRKGGGSPRCRGRDKKGELE